MDDRMFKRLISVRRRIHRWPELAFKEHKTGDAIAKYIDRLSIPYKRGIAKTGIVAQLITDPGAPTVALRADMDALPIEEKTELPFTSKVKGHMHACGHDGHIAMVLGAVELLLKSPPAGNVVFLFQPAEEGGGGAQGMIKKGVLEGVDMIFGGHIDGHFKVGEIAIRKGTETSYTDGLKIRILGKGGHAARPHEAVDAVMVSSLFVLELQNIISRGTDPLSPTVITIGSLHSGTAHNVIADEALMHGTIRNTEGNTRKQVIKRIKKTASALAALHDADIRVEITQGYPPVVNHPEAYKIARDAAEQTLGNDKVINLAKPSMGGEDFSYFLQKIPGCFVRIGARGRNTKVPTAHSSYFDFDEEAIRVGAAFFARAVKTAIDRIRQGSIRH
jgi:hippurate hydrolase